MPQADRTDVASAAAVIIRDGRRPTVREIADLLKPIGNSTVATAFREWMRTSLLALVGTSVELSLSEEAERRVAITFDAGRAFLFIGDVMIGAEVDALADALSRDQVVIAGPTEGGGIIVTLPNGNTFVRLTSDEYAFLNGKVAAYRATRHGEAQ